LTPDEIRIAKSENLVPSVVSTDGGMSAIAGGGVARYLSEHPDGNLLVDGKMVKVQRGYTVGSLDVAQVSYNGKTYYVDEHGRWFQEPPQVNKKLPPVVVV
jgi:hypothetical protein